jgi:hypothetical protein
MKNIEKLKSVHAIKNTEISLKKLNKGFKSMFCKGLKHQKE